MSLWLSTNTLMGPSVPAWLEDTCQRLVDNEKSLKIVELTHPRIDDVFARIFAKALDENHTVTALILSCFAIVDDGASAIGSVLARNKSIQKLQLRDLRNSREVITFFEFLLQNRSIEELSLRHCHICPLGAEAIRKVLELHPTLREVRFIDSQIPSDSVQVLCNGLKKNRTIQRLYFVNTELESDSAIYISDVLKENVPIRELYLCENEFGDEGVASLAEGVLHSSTIEILDLRSNNITSQGALSLQGMIVSCKSLVGINLSNNDLGNAGTSAVARGLQQPACRLQKIDLSVNGIDKAGAVSLASALKTNQSLEHLNLSFNPIGDDGAIALASALVRNKTLRTLALRRNSIGNAGAFALAQKLPNMDGLKELILSKNKIDDKGAAALLHGLRSNVELEYLQVEEKLSEPVAREIVHWIRLNKAGRRLFRHTNVPNTLWPLVYERISTDCEALFHFLTEKPDVLTDSKKRKLSDSYNDDL